MVHPATALRLVRRRQQEVRQQAVLSLLDRQLVHIEALYVGFQIRPVRQRLRYFLLGIQLRGSGHVNSLGEDDRQRAYLLVQVRANLFAQRVLLLRQRKSGLRYGQLRGGQLLLRVVNIERGKRPQIELLLGKRQKRRRPVAPRSGHLQFLVA